MFLEFLDMLVIRKGYTLDSTVYRKLISTGSYLYFQSNHPSHAKRGVTQSVHHRATTICQGQQDSSDKTDIRGDNLQLGAYSTGFIDSVTNRLKGGIHLKNEVKPLGFTFRLCVRGVSEKLNLQQIGTT